ncbi:hypothetical protein [Ramlibacter alkalitolerans]|uniref:DUF4124 domain-containing protein n=1 Tax=Ramlibacter alkalitolerans TaxID=2039631 RepID=A0ABS1JJQ4_9BURK|nr:hypothetical protein [Ramlibacter alkalitolerans]MBL0424447.1 hypothetical protein [Ramlibacter alkalitolerans]
MKKNNMPVLLGALALCAAAPASAALYRCGNVFQDRPCEVPVAKEAERAASAAVPAPKRAASAATAEPAHAAQPPASAAPTVEASAAAAASVPLPAPPPRVRKGPPSLACPNLREQRTAIEARLSAGGRPETIRMYQRQLRGIESNLDDGNCPRD